MKKLLPRVVLGILLLGPFLFPRPVRADIENAEADPDINISKRGNFDPQPAVNNLQTINGLILIGGPTDPRAPQLKTISSSPSIKTRRQVGNYEGTAAIPADNTNNWGVTLSGLTNAGETIRVPQSGYDIGEGYQAVILYATETEMTISYTNGGDGIVRGYAMHVLNFQTNPDLLRLYRENLPEGKIIELPCGYPLGTSKGTDLVSIRDTGSFMDPRSQKDWWQTSPQVNECLPLEPKAIVIGQSSGPARAPTTLGSPRPRPYVPCDQTRPGLDLNDKEFHSLRPYQASPCDTTVHEEMLMCGNDLVIQKGIVVTPAEAEDCDSLPGGGQHCTFAVDRSAQISVNLRDAELPILGNTQLVPNSYNTVEAIDEKTRMNEYVSWYINGTVFRAEDHPPNVEDLINLSGPIRKLLSWASQNDLRQEQANAAGVTRHNQVIARIFGPAAGGEPAGSLGVRIRNFLSAASYAPFSSTEDRVGEIEVPAPPDGQSLKDVTPPPPGSEVGISYVNFIPTTRGALAGKDDLYFAHIQEALDLSNSLQGTFAPGGEETYSEDSGPKTTKEFLAYKNKIQQVIGGNCQAVNARSNPGDDLFGDQNQFGYTQLAGRVEFGATFECDFRPRRQQSDDFAACVAFCDANTDSAAEQAECVNARCYYQAETSCQKDALVAIPIYTRTPGIKEIWERLVDGSFGVFKRFMPQGLVEIKETPAETRASYTTDSEAVFAGGASKPGSQASIYFPYLGGVYDYFLKGIQCALRPQGYCQGEAIIAQAAQQSRQQPSMCTFENSRVQSQRLLQIISQAASWGHVPPDVLLAVVRKEACGICSNDPFYNESCSVGGLCTFDDATVNDYIENNIPYNCNGDADGPLQFYPSPWATDWGHAVTDAIGKPNPEICNIEDAIYAGALYLSAHYPTPVGNGTHDITSTPINWSLADKQRVLSRWAYGGGAVTCATEPANPGDFAWFYCQFIAGLNSPDSPNYAPISCSQ